MRNNTHYGFALLAILVGAFVLAGCTQETGPYGSDVYGRGFDNQTMGARGGAFGNLTEEQRQQFTQARMQAAVQACLGKANGDACTLDVTERFGRNGSEGNSNRASEGKCEAVDGQTMCRPDFRRQPG